MTRGYLQVVLYITMSVFVVVIIVVCCSKYRRTRHIQRQGQRPRAQHSMIYSVTMQGNTSRTLYDAVAGFLNARNVALEPVDSDDLRNNSTGTQPSQKPVGPPSYEEVMSSESRRQSGPPQCHPDAPPPYSEATHPIGNLG